MEINKIHNMDCIEGMKLLVDNSVDAVVTDPPYGLEFMGKEWDTFDKKQFGIKGTEGENDLKVKKNFNILPRYNSDGLYNFTLNWAVECLRVLKPGGFLLSFGGSRTYHRMASGIEDAGFEIRDQIMWIYGSGFPKSLNIGKAVDKLQGNEREIIREEKEPAKQRGNTPFDMRNSSSRFLDKGNSEWEGWGTALKPAHEPIVVARKPLSEKSVALNVLKWGTGGINIDESRIKFESDDDFYNPTIGRFPANIIHDGSDEVTRLFPESNATNRKNIVIRKEDSSSFGGKAGQQFSRNEFGDSGSAARFFYCAKADKKERNKYLDGVEEKQVNDGRKNQDSIDCPQQRGLTFRKNFHPTVKPVDLMVYLIKLVSRENALVLDPFIGSGTTAVACKYNNRNFIGFEKSREYCDIANKRLSQNIMRDWV